MWHLFGIASAFGGLLIVMSAIVMYRDEAPTTTNMLEYLADVRAILTIVICTTAVFIALIVTR